MASLYSPALDVHQGNENQLMSLRKYTINFTCKFELQDYPFDVQDCAMIFQLKKPTRNEAVLNLRSFEYSGGEDLLEYRVMNTSFISEYECGAYVPFGSWLSRDFRTAQSRCSN